MKPCTRCGAAVPDQLRDCPKCGSHHGFPNVKAAESESAGLDARYAAAAGQAAARGCQDEVRAFEQAAASSHAVVNVDVGFLHEFITQGNVLYSSYSRLLAGGARVPAASEQDRRRISVEGLLFGSYGGDLTYAALSLDGRGLTSYGSVSIELSDAAIEERASLLEENSYGFVRRHRLLPGDPLPSGYRATWRTRTRLVIAKLADRITTLTTARDHAGLLLVPAPARSDDDFVEVHIYGTFSRDAISGVRADEPQNEPDRILLEAARAKAASLAIQWT